MRKVLMSLLCVLTISGFAQIPRYNSALLDTLQNIVNSKTPSKHFALLYYKAIEITNAYAHHQPQHVKDFIFGFETKFGPTFFSQHNNYIQNKPTDDIWKTYYTNANYNELLYQFIGMNAHINGNMWQGLVYNYAADTIRYYKKHLLQFQKAFNVFFDSMYQQANTYKKVHRLNNWTLGIGKIYGRKLIYKWRKRQVNMAIWYYTKPKKHQRVLIRLNKKKQRFDKFAIKHIH